MTELVERPEPTNLVGSVCSPHDHTLRCWWHVELAGWVCPPYRDGAS